MNEQLILFSKFLEEADNVFNQLFQDPSASTDKRWYPTTETCDDPDRLARRISDEIQLREAENLNPRYDDEQRQTFLKNFSWDNSTINEQEQQRMEVLLVKYHMTFAPHRLDIVINTILKFMLTPKRDVLVYAQSLPTPTNLNDDPLVELALMQE